MTEQSQLIFGVITFVQYLTLMGGGQDQNVITEILIAITNQRSVASKLAHKAGKEATNVQKYQNNLFLKYYHH